MPKDNEQLDRLELINDISESFGLDLRSEIEAALASQWADWVIGLLARERRLGANDEAVIAMAYMSMDKAFEYMDDMKRRTELKKEEEQ